MTLVAPTGGEFALVARRGLIGLRERDGNKSRST